MLKSCRLTKTTKLSAERLRKLDPKSGEGYNSVEAAKNRGARRDGGLLEFGHFVRLWGLWTLDPGLSPHGQEFPVPRHSEATKSAIKNRTDIVALVGEYLPLRRVGTKYKALCPWHDDHNPSLEVNPERQSFKCWVCGVGGDVFDFVKNIERVEFPEALRMLADRAGIALESPPSTATAPRGPSKSELYEVNAWAEEIFAAGAVGFGRRCSRLP